MYMTVMDGGFIVVTLAHYILLLTLRSFDWLAAFKLELLQASLFIAV